MYYCNSLADILNRNKTLYNCKCFVLLYLSLLFRPPAFRYIWCILVKSDKTPLINIGNIFKNQPLFLLWLEMSKIPWVRSLSFQFPLYSRVRFLWWEQSCRYLVKFEGHERTEQQTIGMSRSKANVLSYQVRRSTNIILWCFNHVIICWNPMWHKKIILLRSLIMNLELKIQQW